MSKKSRVKKKVLKFTPKVEQEAEKINLASAQGEIAKELVEWYQAMQHLATAHNLLDRGLYKHGEYQQVVDSMVFIRAMHQEVKNNALAHPDCEKIPELLEMKTKIQLAAMEQSKQKTLQDVVEGKPDDAS